ncbi:MAG: hypothetical protein WCF19_03620 [Chlamydiales bacterium]
MLRTNKREWSVQTREEIDDITSLLLAVFNAQHVKQISSHLPQTILPQFNAMYGVLYEIQENMQKGATEYRPLTDCWPRTKAVIDQYGSKVSRVAIFAILKKRSGEIHPFPLEIEPIRIQTFYKMMERLKPREQEERKGEPPASPQPLEPLTPEMQKAAVQIYCQGALRCGRQILFFHQMLQAWAKVSGKESELQQLLNALEITDWISQAPIEEVQHYQFSTKSFRAFLIYYSIEAIKTNLSIPIPPIVRKKLDEDFLCEQIRHELCFFATDPEKFLQVPLSNRSSTPLILSLQLFLFLKQGTNVLPNDYSALLITLLHMRDTFDSEKIPDFASKKLTTANGRTFEESWRGLKQILQAIHGKQLQSIFIEDELEYLLKTRQCWDLLFWLWISPQRTGWISTLTEFAYLAPGHFAMDLASALDFSTRNGHQLDPRASHQLLEAYKRVIGAFLNKGKARPHMEALFFSPPILWSKTWEENLETKLLLIKIDNFINQIQYFPLTDQNYWLLLRRYIICPFDASFQLLRWDKLNLTENLVWEALSSEDPLFCWEQLPQEATRQIAQQTAIGIQEQYGFNSEQIYPIYLKILRIQVEGKGDQMEKFVENITQLIQFCPAFRQENIALLYRHQPEINDVENLNRLLKYLADQDLDRFVINQVAYQTIIRSVSNFIQPLEAICGDQFGRSLHDAILSRFFPPLQPLTDSLRITSISDTGVEWGERVWATHLGLLKFIQTGASIGVYLNWEICNDQPIFHLSFFDINTMTAVSAFIPTNVSATAMDKERIREPFYGLLRDLGQHVLREEAEPSSSPLDETPQSWALCYTGVTETLANYIKLLSPSYIEKIWEFLVALKKAYRMCFFRCIGTLPLSDVSKLDARTVAMEGHIFPNEDRLSLIPAALMTEKVMADWYAPDANEDFVKQCRELFQTSTRTTLLNLIMRVSPENFPIYYEVQTAEELTGEVVQSKVRNEVAPPKEQTQGRYVTLTANGVRKTLRYPPEAFENSSLFLRYFYFQNLQLKATVKRSLYIIR